MAGPPRRVLLDCVLPPAACQELLLIARSLAVIGYRQGVCSATVFEVAAALPAALVPLVAAREAVRAAVEEALGQPLLVEFTGLIGWRPGSAIDWHHDANRPYLRQRTHSAVCYLQQAGREFGGGTLRFQAGPAGPAQDVLARPGSVVVYDAQDVHSVAPVTRGERCALTLWFTDRPEHCEDARLLAQLAGGPPSLGLPASMWALPDGGDLRLCRLAMRGIALVHRGQLLHAADALPEDAPGLRLQLAAIPAALQAWAEEDGQAAAAGIPEMRQGSACSSAGGAAAPTAALVPAVEFSSVQQAVLAVQHWAWRRRPDRWGVERVCSTHLRGAACDTGPAAAGACCSWLRSCQLAKDAAPGELAAELAEAAAQSQAWLAAHEAALQALRPRWLQLGALFIE